MTYPKTLIFVRHGETTAHVDANRFCGTLDPDLTEKGLAQADRAADVLKRLMLPIEEAWVSPRKRTRETAARLLSSAAWQIKDDLQELAFGQWEGLTKEEAAHLTPAAYLAWDHDSFTSGPPGGESGLQAQARIGRIIDDIERSTAQTILIVSHTTYLRLLIGEMMDIPHALIRHRLEIQLGRLGLMEVEGRRGKLKALNL